MSLPPSPLKIYHITHCNNLSGIVSEGCLWSDAKRLERCVSTELVGMSMIKQRRLTELIVTCYKGTFVVQYVPFYFCPRSIMLYILYKGNHPEIAYTGGQEPILHLQADVARVVRWAKEQRVRWAFSTRSAGTRYCHFHKSLDKLGEIDWDAVAAQDFRDQAIKDGKQAEFLVYECLPWDLVEVIGVYDPKVAEKVKAIIGDSGHQPTINVQPEWNDRKRMFSEAHIKLAWDTLKSGGWFSNQS